MELIDNISRLLGDDLKQTLRPGARLKVAASCFSMYAFEALKAELGKIDELDFIFTSPTFVANEVTDKIRKERKEFHIPKLDRERSLYGSEFEIQLRNKLTQRAVAKECAEWIRRKAKFKSNRTKAPMQQFACVQAGGTDTAYMPLHGFTAVDLGYQQGNVVSNLVNKMDYGMTDGSIRMRVRAAVAGYMLLRWSVDASPHHSLTEEQYRLWLSDPLALYGVENAKLAPGYRAPATSTTRK
ncbi:hypothetical protein [Acinetobacter sp. c3-l95]|uniref:hypothetical protein n=1 Tax=Acinetobacter sp. c3-l95 TaxID=3342804 RepID=UPI0035BA39AC